MRKLLMSLLAAVTLISASGQKKTQEEVRIGLANGMANFVTAVKPFYVKGQDQQKFIATVTKSWKPAKEGIAVLSKAFELITKNSSPDKITSTYNGKEMAAAILYLKKVQDTNAKSDGAEIFGGPGDNTTNAAARDGECKWYQLWCHLQNFANWIVEHWPVIKDILTTIAVLL